MTSAEQNGKISSVESFLGPNTLELLGVLDDSAIRIINPWHMGGAETYVTDFEVDKRGISEHLIAKACVKFSPLKTMEEWLERRSILQENGVLFPKLIVVDGATIIEEFIPYTFNEAYLKSGEHQKERLREQYIMTYKRIYGAGFRPTGLHDIRSHGDDVVVIDVGEDMGGHNQINVCSLDVNRLAVKSLDSYITSND
jgi:hypothetical protein